jgi:hypothetical protein
MTADHWPVIEAEHGHGDTVFLAACTCGWHSGTTNGWNWFPSAGAARAAWKRHTRSP